VSQHLAIVAVNHNLIVREDPGCDRTGFRNALSASEPGVLLVLVGAGKSSITLTGKASETSASLGVPRSERGVPRSVARSASECSAGVLARRTADVPVRRAGVSPAGCVRSSNEQRQLTRAMERALSEGERRASPHGTDSRGARRPPADEDVRGTAGEDARATGARSRDVQNPEEPRPRGTARNREDRGTPEEPRNPGTPRNSEEPRGTPRNSKEPGGPSLATTPARL
jgi:hypothetical protein